MQVNVEFAKAKALENKRANAGDAFSPAWHGDELAYREAALARGDESVEDWAAARQRIRYDAR